MIGVIMGGLFISPFMILSIFIITVLCGLIAGWICKISWLSGVRLKFWSTLTACIFAPVVLMAISKLTEVAIDNIALAKRNAIWQKETQASLGGHEFVLPLHPRQHWIYINEFGDRYGVNLQRTRGRNNAKAILYEQSSSITLTSLTLMRASPDCDKLMSERGARSGWVIAEYCKGTAVSFIDKWCALNPNKPSKPWCDTGFFAQNFELRYSIKTSENLAALAGKCLETTCFVRIDITDTVAALIKFDQAIEAEQIENAKLYAKDMWFEIIKTVSHE